MLNQNKPSLPMPITAAPYAHQQAAFDFACRKFGLLPSDFFSRGVALLMEMAPGIENKVKSIIMKAGGPAQ